jgi:pumilio family protein 6
MAGIKRKDAPSGAHSSVKKQKTDKPKPTRPPTDHPQNATSDGDDFGGFSDTEDAKRPASNNGNTNGKPKQFKLETSSAEAHAKQRQLAKERKASKPNADAIQRSKKIWERLRRKSHVPLEERKALVAELFEIISGRVSDFVFKHDSVRVIQCALKYANTEQRRQIVQELKGDVRQLAESRYAKFLVAKMITSGDDEIRDAIVPQFYGHVRRLINHSEASWIVDDIYRQVASNGQRTVMLREWFGAEFALENRNRKKDNVHGADGETADLTKILEMNPEKRTPVLRYLLQMINGLVQKKMTGFTMSHDAMLQYFLVLKPGSEEQTEFLEILKGDIDKETEGGGGDLFRNLAFTKSGSRLVCLAIAYANAKDRRVILRVFKDAIEMMAYDQFARMVLVVGLDVPDDTKTSAKIVLPELLGQHIGDETQRLDRLEAIVTNLNARLPVLYPFAGMAKWLLGEPEKAILNEVYEIRNTTSKKAPEVRRKELIEHFAPALLQLVSKRAESLAKSSFGCQFITEILLESPNVDGKAEAKVAVAALAEGHPNDEDHIAKNAAAGRMLKTLVLGGQFDSKTKQISLAEERLVFGAELYPVIKDRIVEWACGDSSFVIVGLLESEDVDSGIKDEVRAALKKGKKKLDVAVKGGGGKEKGNAGARILMEKI